MAINGKKRERSLYSLWRIMYAGRSITTSATRTTPPTYSCRCTPTETLNNVFHSIFRYSNRFHGKLPQDQESPHRQWKAMDLPHSRRKIQNQKLRTESWKENDSKERAANPFEKGHWIMIINGLIIMHYKYWIHMAKAHFLAQLNFHTQLSIPCQTLLVSYAPTHFVYHEIANNI